MGKNSCPENTKAKYSLLACSFSDREKIASKYITELREREEIWNMGKRDDSASQLKSMVFCFSPCFIPYFLANPLASDALNTARSRDRGLPSVKKGNQSPGISEKKGEKDSSKCQMIDGFWVQFSRSDRGSDFEAFLLLLVQMPQAAHFLHRFSSGLPEQANYAATWSVSVGGTLSGNHAWCSHNDLYSLIGRKKLIESGWMGGEREKSKQMRIE